MEKTKITLPQLHNTLRPELHASLISLPVMVIVMAALWGIAYGITCALTRMVWLRVLVPSLLCLPPLVFLGLLIHDAIGLSRTLSQGNYVVFLDEFVAVRQRRKRVHLTDFQEQLLYRFRHLGDCVVSVRTYDSRTDSALSKLHYGGKGGGFTMIDSFHFNTERMADDAQEGDRFYVVFLPHRRSRPIQFFNARHFTMDHNFTVTSLLDDGKL